MTAENPSPASQRTRIKNVYRGGGDAVYGLGLIGAAIYYVTNATTFWMGVLGVLKAIVWPALLMYKVVGSLGF